MAEKRLVRMEEIQIAMDIINDVKVHLKEQGINQWQTGYPDYGCIEKDIIRQKEFYIVEDEDILRYLLQITIRKSKDLR